VTAFNAARPPLARISQRGRCTGARIWENRFAKAVYLRVRGARCRQSVTWIDLALHASVMAGFDGGRVTSEAGAMLLGATDRVRSPRAKPAGHKAYSEISESYARSRLSAPLTMKFAHHLQGE
jgi:hypothetical protein